MIPGPKTILTLQSKTEASDSMGGFTETWADVKDISGVLTRGRGNEEYMKDRMAVVSTHVFFCSYDSVIDVEDRFSYGSRVFDILFVYNPGNMNHHLEIALMEII